MIGSVVGAATATAARATSHRLLGKFKGVWNNVEAPRTEVSSTKHRGERILRTGEGGGYLFGRPDLSSGPLHLDCGVPTRWGVVEMRVDRRVSQEEEASAAM